MAAIPAGFTFLRSRRSGFWRDFLFRVERPITGYRRGDTFKTSVVLKLQ